MSLLDYRDEVGWVPGPTPMTEEEFLEVDGRAEWVEGVTYFMSPVSLDHDTVRGWVYMVLRMLATEKELGRVFGESVAIRFKAEQMRCPDVSFVAKSNLARLERNRVVGVPNLVVEVVSPDSVRRDYVEKLSLYGSEGVQEYWIIDVLERKVLLYRLNDGGTYSKVAEQDGKLVSEVVTGFFFRTQWLIGSAMPSEIRTVREMGVQ